MLSGKIMPCFPVSETKRVLYNLRRTPSRPQVQSILTYVILLFENLSPEGYQGSAGSL